MAVMVSRGDTQCMVQDRSILESADMVGDCKAGQENARTWTVSRCLSLLHTKNGTIGGEIYPNGRSNNVLGSEKARREINSAERERLQPVVANNSSIPMGPESATVKLNGQI
jgi:hypothetical protein